MQNAATDPNRILVIDDEPSVRGGCSLALSERGYSVDVCDGGREGLAAALGGSYDLVLLDMRLPDLDGMEILRQVVGKRSEVCVIAMTGYSSVRDAVAVMKAGAFDYIAKPFTDEELLAPVRTALENKRLKNENTALQRQLREAGLFEDIVGESPGIGRVYDSIARVAPTDTTVLLCGESGTGKELFAQAIHKNSRRCARPFVTADCSTFSDALLESELFGHVKGAFTGATRDKTGIFETADGGTLFLDELANLNRDIQAKLLRAIESGHFKPVGASRARTADVRIIGATNRDLKALAEEGTFREDLYYRLNVFPVYIPPLRERRDDIPRLLYHFLKVFCRQTGKGIEGFSDESLRTLVSHDWPGNVRQLKNVVERLVIMADGRILEHRLLSDPWPAGPPDGPEPVPETLEALKAVKRHLLEDRFGQVEKAFLQQALHATAGNITQAAKRVGMQRSNFSALMKKHGLTAGGPSRPPSATT